MLGAIEQSGRVVETLMIAPAVNDWREELGIGGQPVTNDCVEHLARAGVGKFRMQPAVLLFVLDEIVQPAIIEHMRGKSLGRQNLQCRKRHYRRKASRP